MRQQFAGVGGLTADQAGTHSYDLSPEHRVALAAGDIPAIEEWVGPLEPRLRDWLKERLANEKW